MRLLGTLTGALTAAAAIAPAHAELPVVVSGVAIDTRDDGTVIAVATSAPARYRAAKLEAPPRLVLDLDDASSAWRGSPLRADGRPVTEIRTPPQGAANVKIVIELAHPSDYLVRRSRDGLRVVLPADASGGAPSASARIAPASDPALLGVVRGGRGWVAYLEAPGGDRLAGYRVGDTVADRVVELIDAEKVVLAGPHGRVELRVGDEPAGTIRQQ